MILDYTVRRQGGLAFFEEYVRTSRVHRRTRMGCLAIALLPIVALWTAILVQNGLDVAALAIFAVSIVAMLVLMPWLYDRAVRRQLLAQIDGASYAKNFGPARLTIAEDRLVSEGPTGKTEFLWSAVDRVVLREDYLFIFMAGQSGLPIPVSEVGAEAARTAADLVRSRVAGAAA